MSSNELKITISARDAASAVVARVQRDLIDTLRKIGYSAQELSPPLSQVRAEFEELSGVSGELASQLQRQLASAAASVMPMEEALARANDMMREGMDIGEIEDEFAAMAEQSEEAEGQISEDAQQIETEYTDALDAVEGEAKETFQQTAQEAERTGSRIVAAAKNIASTGFSGLKTTISASFVAARKIGEEAMWALKRAAVASAAAIAAAYGAIKFVELGANLAAAEKTFQRLTGTGKDAARRLAKSLQDASSGGLTLTQTMQAANKMLMQGFDTRQIEEIFKVANAASVATDADADVESTISAVGTAIATGRMMSLQNLGLIREGMKDVSEQYERSFGEGSWSKLSAGQQRAIAMKTIMGELKNTMADLGVTGQETAARMDAFTTPLRDAIAAISKGISESETFASVLGWVEEQGKALVTWAESFSLDHIIASIQAVGQAWFSTPDYALTAMGHVVDIVKAGATGAVQMAWSLIKGGAAIIWEPIKYAAISAWESIVIGARDAVSGIWMAWNWLAGGVRKIFAAVAEATMGAMGKAIAGIGEMLVPLNDVLSRVKGMENIGDKMVAAGGNLQRFAKEGFLAKAAKDQAAEADTAVGKFMRDTQEMQEKSAADAEQRYADMWNNMFQAGADTWEGLKARFSEMTAAQKAEMAALFGHLGGVIPAAPGAKPGGAAAARPPRAMTEQVEQQKEAASWLKDAAKGLGQAGTELKKAANEMTKFERMVEKEKKLALAGKTGGMSIERQRARAVAIEQIRAEQRARAQEGFTRAEAGLAEKVKGGKMTEEEATAAREKIGKKMFGKKGWEAREAERLGKEGAAPGAAAAPTGTAPVKKGKPAAGAPGQGAGAAAGPAVPDMAGAVDRASGAIIGKMQEFLDAANQAVTRLDNLAKQVSGMAAPAGTT